MTRLAIDPVTRVGGHLRIEADVAGARVQDAWSSGTMFRGLEPILRGRDPRDAWLFAQRVCGTCTAVHALASVRAVENALGLTSQECPTPPQPPSATQFVPDHVLHFYTQQAFDWVDVMAALAPPRPRPRPSPPPSATGPHPSATYFKGVRDRLRTFVARAAGAVRQRPLGPSRVHPARRRDLLVLAHYFEALDWQRRFMRVHTLLGGKSPHPQTFLVGGMALAPTWGGPNRALRGAPPADRSNAPQALSDPGLAVIADLIAEASAFVEQVYVPDTLLTAGTLRGPRSAPGSAPTSPSANSPRTTRAPELLMPRGRVGRDLSSVAPVDQAGVAETVAHSHYTYAAATDPPQAVGRRRGRARGPPPPVTTLEDAERYSWIKAPRYQDDRMEVGPLARTLGRVRLPGRGDVPAARSTSPKARQARHRPGRAVRDARPDLRPGGGGAGPCRPTRRLARRAHREPRHR